MRFSLSAKTLSLIAVPLLMDLVLIGTLFFSLRRADELSVALNSSRTIVEKTDRIRSMVSDVALLTTRKSIGMGYTKSMEKVRQQQMNEIESELGLMVRLAQNSPAVSHYKTAYAASREAIDRFRAVTDRDNSTDIFEAVHLVKELTPIYQNVMQSMDAANELESKTLQAAVESEAEMRSSIRNLITCGFTANVILAVLLALVFQRGIARRLATLMDNAARLPKGERFSAPLGGDDEIGQLDNVLRTAAFELNEARKKERFLIENMPIALARLSEEGTIEMVNPEMEELFYLAEQDFLDLKLSDLLQIKDEREIVPGKPIELPLKDKESGKSVELVVKEFGNTKLAAMIDITERLAMQRLRRQFVAMVSHDLRTPLTSVQASLDMVSEGIFGELSEDGLKQIDRAERSVDRMLLLINDLLDLEKIDGASFNLSRSKIRIKDALDQALEATNMRAKESGVILKCKPQEAICFADKERIVQVLINLIDNAIKFSQPGQVVEVSSEYLKDSLEVRVKDQGRGIPEEMREQIFERFVQVSKEDKKKRHGSGLGLAICKAIITSHGGEIGVDSKLGEGSTFWFRLPLEENV
ncbi:MAG: ATP-binding protein [Candidatus Obscuribacter sp.]|nr:ATP-binding protein [Candidatus Obscuribacter sp.]